MTNSTTHKQASADLPDLGRELTKPERELIRLLAQQAAEQFLAGKKEQKSA